VFNFRAEQGERNYRENGRRRDDLEGRDKREITEMERMGRDKKAFS